MKRLVAFLLFITIMLSLVACGSGESSLAITDDDSSIVTGDIPDPNAVPGSIITGGKANYMLVYRADASEIEKKAVEALRHQSYVKTGASFPTSDDSVSNGEGKLEILIGNTNRAETAEALSLAGEYGYVMKMSGNKLVISGTTPYLTYTAVNSFINSVISATENIELDNDYSYVATKESVIPLATDEPITVVRGGSVSDVVLTTAAELIKSLSKGHKTELTVGYDKDFTGPVILLGKTSFPESEYAESILTENQFMIATVGDKIVVTGSNDYSARFALDCFIDNFVDAATGNLTIPVPYEVIGEVKYINTSDDPHTVTEAADISQLQRLYAGLNAYTGELHAHTNTPPKADGHTSLVDMKAQAKALGMDFMLICDHRQTTHPFHPDWDTNFFIVGTEPGTVIKDGYKTDMHYIIVAPNGATLVNILTRFKTLFNYNIEEGTYTYPSFTTAEFKELTEYTRSVGGFITIAHPTERFTENDNVAPLDPIYWYYGEYTLFEVLYMSREYSKVLPNYNRWSGMLMEGKKIYCSGSTDTHREARNTELNTVFAASTNESNLMNSLRAGNFCAGQADIRMSIGNTVMGGSTVYNAGEKLLVSISDVKQCKAGSYTVTVYTDQGIAYTTEASFDSELKFSIDIQDRSFYRVEISNPSKTLLYALSQPIWLD